MYAEVYAEKKKRRRKHDRFGVAAVAVAFVVALVPFAADEAEATHGGIHFGFQETDWNDLQQTDLPSTKYSAMWARPNQDYIDDQLGRAEARGHVPVVHFYYWGDKISPSCVEFGCDGLSIADWRQDRQVLIDQITAEMGGKETIVTIELEFNKQGIEDDPHPVTGEPYHETFEDYLVEHVNAFEAVAGVKTIVGFGEWGSSHWHKFSRAVDASSILGTQLLWTDKGHVITNAAERTVNALGDLKSIFSGSQYPQQTFIYDWGLSTWGPNDGWQYEDVQATEMSQLRAASATMRNDHNLLGFVFRTIDDGGNTNERWGEAECCFGYALGDMSQFKAGYSELRSWLQEEGGVSGDLPASIEGEDFATKSTGGLSTSASYSGGEAWNIWTNGYIEHSVSNPTTASHGLTIMAKGNLAGTELPHMRLHVNGVVVDEWDVSTETVEPYTTTASLPSGTVTFRIEFTNDFMSGSEDRNLIVDVLHIDGTASEQWRQEVESMACTVGGQSSDPTASGGASWNLWSNGHCDATITTGVTGPQDLRIVARGDPAAGVWPQAEVYVDGSRVATWDIIDDDWLPYVVSVDMTAGNHALEIHFVNDGNVNGDDRNLHLDVASVEG